VVAEMNKTLLGVIIVVAVVGLVIVFNMGKSSADLSHLKEFDGKVTIYKSQSCGCCGLYLNYFKSASGLDVEIVDSEDLSSLKRELGVPREMESCHTIVIGDYFVEGHIPVEAISKLMAERPDIAGIAMPGMPSGSPGMPGAKEDDFIVYAVNFDGSYEEYTRV
jgi:hypothetical protein